MLHRSGVVGVLVALVAAVGCSSGDDEEEEITPLSGVEQDLTGKWLYHHDYDDSDRYYVFDADRTGCQFQYDEHNSRSEYKDVTYWALEDQGEDLFLIRLAGPGISSQPLGYLTSDEYHHELDEIWRGGYDTLRMRPTTTDRGCD